MVITCILQDTQNVQTGTMYSVKCKLCAMTKRMDK